MVRVPLAHGFGALPFPPLLSASLLSSSLLSPLHIYPRTMAWDLNSPNVAIGGLSMPSHPCTALLQFPEVSSLHAELFAESLHLQCIGSIRLHYCAHAARKLLLTVPISVVKLSGPDGIFAHLSMFCIWRAWVSKVPMLSKIWCIRKSATVRVVLEKWNVCTCSLKLYCTWAEYF